MESEIREQPSLLARQAPVYAELLKSFGLKKPQMVVIAARGSSDNAALYARYLIEVELGIPVALAAPSVLTRFGRKIEYPPCLGIGISQSGAAPDVAEVLGALREAGHQTLALTNTPDSRLAQNVDYVLPLGVGTEKSVAATKTYSATLLALYQLVRALGAPLPAPEQHLPNEAWLELARGCAQNGVEPVCHSQPVFALGRGYSFCTALETSLKLMECALIPCKSFSSADFQHGPRALAGEGSAALMFDGDESSLRGQGCTTILPPIAPCSELLKPIWQIVFSQWLALLCAREKGLDPDQPPHLKKVTETR